MTDCPYCPGTFDCKNNLLHHIVQHHNADMSEWPTP